METDAKRPGDNGSLNNAIRIRDALIKYMAETLRDLPNQYKAFLHLPRCLVGTEWARWEQHADPVPYGHGFRFHTLYQFSPSGEWDPDTICDRLSELWKIWGWECTNYLETSGDRSSIEGQSADGWQFELTVARNIRSSGLLVTTPEFSVPESSTVTMPFAVTPFGTLSLADVWLVYPDLARILRGMLPVSGCR